MEKKNCFQVLIITMEKKSFFFGINRKTTKTNILFMIIINVINMIN